MRGWHALLAATAAMLVSCASRNAAPMPVLPDRTSNAQRDRGGEGAGRCRRFAGDFAELAACRRADGTLRTFDNPQVAWRVRYFVRYWEMPCGEAPTREESYVFQMTTRDLYGDADLTGAQRRAIRDAMFGGPVGCR